MAAVTSRRSPILDEIGGPPIELRHLPEQDRSAAWDLLHSLRCACGSLDRGPFGGFETNRYRGSWRVLRDVSAETLRHTVRLNERAHPGWRLTLESSGDIHEQIEVFLMGDAM